MTTALPAATPAPISTKEQAAALDSEDDARASGCPRARGGGTVPPAISIASTTFVVNGLEQVVRGGDRLQASPGDEVQLRKATICCGSFSGPGGEACVDITPADEDGLDIGAEHLGTHMVRVRPGVISLAGPGETLIIGEDWRYLSVVLNHWAPEDTADLDCAAGRCERDDRILVGLR